jgi:cap1 methyltransferase
LALLRLAGTMIVKMFGFQTEVVRTVMHDLFFLFDSMIILKPISSRPASAERYVVCSGFKGLPTRWDGPRWRNRMFLGKSMALGPTTPGRCENTSQRLNRYLDRFDCDLLTLNLKACFAILSYLENKCMVVNRADYTEHTYFSAERALVNIESYKYTWRLVYER